MTCILTLDACQSYIEMAESQWIFTIIFRKWTSGGLSEVVEEGIRSMAGDWAANTLILCAQWMILQTAIETLPGEDPEEDGIKRDAASTLLPRA